MKQILAHGKHPQPESIVARIASEQEALLAYGRQAVEAFARRQIRVLALSQLPPALQTLPDPPLWLFVEGNVQALFHKPAVAVVGTRTPSPEGLEAAARIAKLLGGCPITLVSGLAEGIDTAVHTAALLRGLPNVAFLGHGLDTTYPEGNRKLRAEILEKGGAIATEYLPGEGPKSNQFVARNRLIAGLSDLVIAVEGAPSGGTAHTVRFARRYGKIVVGVRWAGCAGLARDLEAAGGTVVDLFTPEGEARLEKMVGALTTR
ncbi:MAG: DNA-protecting protein DprA [Armatimonadetes bacterium]|nr:DNA-protecting protein DprA [Armatimonadota bacterium]